MYAVVDVETTGNHRGGDRIIEIAIIITDGEKIIKEYQTLVNPQKSINPYVERLTGIYESMVKTAPTFSEVAEEVFHFLEGHVFVAHNVSFDYTLVEGELNRAGYAFNASQIDTIAYARRVFQGLQSYSLGNVCDSLGLPHLDRHRAYGDTLATTHLLHLLLKNDSDGSSLKSMLQQGLDEKCLPPLLSKEKILSLPATTGLLSFRTEDGLLFAIEATKNMRKKAIDKLQIWFSDIKEKNIFESIADVEFIPTGNELIAKIMKEEVVANERPIVGKIIISRPPAYAIMIENNSIGIAQLKITYQKDIEDQPHILFTSRTYAKKAAEKIMTEGRFYGNYQQLIEQTNEELKEAQIKKYNTQLATSLLSSTYSYPNQIIIDKAADNQHLSVVWIEKGKYIGWSTIEKDQAVSQDQLADLIPLKSENTEIQKAIRNHLKKTKVQRLIRY